MAHDFQKTVICHLSSLAQTDIDKFDELLLKIA